MQRLDDKGEHDESEKKHSQFLKTREEPAKALQPTEQPLNFMTAFVHLPVIRPRGASILAWRYNGRNPTKGHGQVAGFLPLVGPVQPPAPVAPPKRRNSWRPSGASCACPRESETVTAGRASAATRCRWVVQPARDLPMACGPFFRAPVPK